ncbi:universal stress protein [Natrialbaceae archaeon A-gly3]
MTDRILIPTDGSEGATAALEYAIDLAHDRGATLHVLYVVDTTRDGLTATEEDVLAVYERNGRETVEAAAERAVDRGVSAIEAVERGDPHEAIHEYAAEKDIDLLVMGTRGRQGLERFFLGSVAERVVRTSEVPVLTVQAGAGGSYPLEDVLIATDGSECARAAIERGSSLAVDGATVHLLSVVDVAAVGGDVATGELLEGLEATARESLEDGRDVATAAGVGNVVSTLEVGRVAPEITSYAQAQDVDAIVVGTHGRRGVERYLMGSVAERVVRTADRPVVTVRR